MKKKWGAAEFTSLFIPGVILFCAFVFGAEIVLNNLMENLMEKSNREACALTLEIENLSRDDNFQLFYDIGRGFTEKHSVKVPVKASAAPVSVQFVFKPGFKNLNSVRIDPGTAPGIIVLHSISLSYNSNFYTWDIQGILSDFKPANDLRPFTVSNNGILIESNGDDPYFVSRPDFNRVFQDLKKVYSFQPPQSPLSKKIAYPAILLFTIILAFIFIRLCPPLIPHLSSDKMRGFRPGWLIIGALLAAVTATACMSFISGYNEHPDEAAHALAAKYYYSHWLPPKVGDPEARRSYSVYGTSYLDAPGIEYFITGKLGSLTNLIINNETLSLRLFNLTLFTLLAAFAIIRFLKDRDNLVVFSILLISPQLWYIFCYVNNDAFPLFLSFLALSSIFNNKSLWNLFLNEKPGKFSWWMAVPFGIILGLLMISKTHYLAFILFVFIWALFSSSEKKDVHRENNLRKHTALRFNHDLLFRWGIAFLVGCLILVARMAADTAVNGFDNKLKLAIYTEQIAGSEFKISTVKNDPGASYLSFMMKEKGVPYMDLFSKYNWAGLSFDSFTGIYGYMNITSIPAYYTAAGIFMLLLALLVLQASLNREPSTAKLPLSLVLLCVFLVIFSSSIRSWVYDFQPQGRYLFPIIPVASAWIYTNRKDLNNFTFHCVLISLFSLSLYSFIFTGIRETIQ